MPETPNAIGYKLLPRAATPDSEQQQVLRPLFDPLGGHTARVTITGRTDKDDRKPDIDYFSITRDVSG